MRWLAPIPGLTNFYLREGDRELRHAFRLPPNIDDGFETAKGAALTGWRGTPSSAGRRWGGSRPIGIVHNYE